LNSQPADELILNLDSAYDEVIPPQIVVFGHRALACTLPPSPLPGSGNFVVSPDDAAFLLSPFYPVLAQSGSIEAAACSAQALQTPIAILANPFSPGVVQADFLVVLIRNGLTARSSD
jgi:hypothetical protein